VKRSADRGLIHLNDPNTHPYIHRVQNTDRETHQTTGRMITIADPMKVVSSIASTYSIDQARTQAFALQPQAMSSRSATKIDNVPMHLETNAKGGLDRIFDLGWNFGVLTNHSHLKHRSEQSLQTPGEDLTHPEIADTQGTDFEDQSNELRP